MINCCIFCSLVLWSFCAIIIFHKLILPQTKSRCDFFQPPRSLVFFFWACFTTAPFFINGLFYLISIKNIRAHLSLTSIITSALYSDVLLGIYLMTSSTLQHRISHMSSSVAVEILRLCLRESKVPLLKWKSFIKVYVVIPLFFIVFHIGSYVIIETTSRQLLLYLVFYYSFRHHSFGSVVCLNRVKNLLYCF